MKQVHFLPAALMSLMTLVSGLAGSDEGPGTVHHPHMKVDALPSLLQHPHQPFINWHPGPEYCDSVRMFQGIPSVAVAPGGQRLWATWYGGGTGEGSHNYVLLATSGDGGETWSDVLATIDPPYRASEPAVWVDPDGVLWWMWNQYPHRLTAPGSQLWAMTTRNPDDMNPTWDSPRLIAMEMNNFNKPTVLRDGTWLWPAGSWQWRTTRGHLSRPLFSRDGGQTFHYKGGVPTPPELNAFDEYLVVEREDGVLWLMNRMREYGIGQSFSHDGGETWSPFEWSGIHHTTSRFYFGRLQSGNLLLVKNGPLDEDVGRSQMMAFLSKDDGDTWVGGLMLDERDRVSYPDSDQAPDGTIHVIYDRGRTSDREILLASFTEEDVLAGEPVSEQARFKVVVNKATGTGHLANNDGEPLRDDLHGALTAEGFQAKSLEAGVQLLADRNQPPYFAKNIPTALSGARFLPLPMDGEKTVRVTRSGTVFFLTPRPERNRDSQSQALIEQGFRLVALPEFPLMKAGGGDDRNLVSLYQKDVAAGETITIGKWAIPVFFP